MHSSSIVLSAVALAVFAAVPATSQASTGAEMKTVGEQLVQKIPFGDSYGANGCEVIFGAMNGQGDELENVHVQVVDRSGPLPVFVDAFIFVDGFLPGDAVSAGSQLSLSAAPLGQPTEKISIEVSDDASKPGNEIVEVTGEDGRTQSCSVPRPQN